MGSNHCKCESCEEFEADFPGVLVPTELVIPQKAFGDTAAEDDTQDTAEDDAAFTQGDSAFIQASVGSLSKHTGPGHCACHCQGEDLRFQGGPLGVKGEGLDLELTPLEFGRDNELVHREVSPLLLALDGKWYLKSNERCICAIQSSEVYFHHDTSLKDTVHFVVQEGPNLVSLRMMRQTFYGEVSLDAQATITWNHGEVWIKQ
ncbi:unnamed protein product [Durusdinium trenchii]